MHHSHLLPPTLCTSTAPRQLPCPPHQCNASFLCHLSCAWWTSECTKLCMQVCKMADRIKEAPLSFLRYLVQPVSRLGERYGNTGGHVVAGSVTDGETGYGSFSFQWGEAQLDRFTQQQHSFGQRMPAAETQAKRYYSSFQVTTSYTSKQSLKQL